MRTLIALAVLLVVAGCGSESDSEGPDSGRSNPEFVVKQLLSSLEAGSCTDVKDVVLTPAAVDCEMVGTLQGSFADDGIDLADVSYTTDVEEGSGSVTADWGNGDPDASWQVERIYGAWKVVFDSAE